MKQIRSAALAAIMVLSGTAQAEDVRIGRYQTLEPVPTNEQMKPLEVIVLVHFPARVTTVGGAITHLLARSGYSLADTHDAEPALLVLLSRPLPEVHRELGPVTLERALGVLAGPVWRLVVDPVHRLVSYELRSRYRDEYRVTLPVPPASPSPVNMSAKPSGTSVEDLPARAPTPAHRAGPPHTAIPGESYGPVFRGETLSAIASAIHLPGVTPDQALVALLEANPHAFGHINGSPNMNLLLSGVTLRIPTAEDAGARSHAQAVEIVGQHWRDRLAHTSEH